MTFTELMSLMAFIAPFFGSLDSAWKTGRSGGLLIGLIVGLVVGVGSFFGARAFCRWAGRSTAHPGGFWIVSSWFLVAALFVCIGCVSVVAHLFTQFIIRHVAA